MEILATIIDDPADTQAGFIPDHTFEMSPHDSVISTAMRQSTRSIRVPHHLKNGKIPIKVDTTDTDIVWSGVYLSNVYISDISRDGYIIFFAITRKTPFDSNCFIRTYAIAHVGSRLAKWLMKQWNGLHQQQLFHERRTALEKDYGIDPVSVQCEICLAFHMRGLDDESIQQKREHVREELGLDNNSLAEQRRRTRQQLRALIKAERAEIERAI